MCHRRAFAFIVSVSLVATPAFAANRSYIGGAGTGNWFTSGNWSPDGQPAQGDNVAISPTDALARTVMFNPSGPLWVSYGSTFVNSNSTGTTRLHNPGNAWESTSLAIGRNGTYSQEFSSAHAFVTTTVLTDNGLISIGNGSFSTVNMNQFAGTLEGGPFHVSGTYSMQGGAMNGNVENTGTFDFAGGSSSSGNLVNRGTFLHRGQTGSFIASVENYGTIVMTTNATLKSLRNHVAMFISGNDRIITRDNLFGITQHANTFFMSGQSSVQTGRVWLDGGHWNQFGGVVDATNLNVGKAGAGESIYQLNDGIANIFSAWVGGQNSSGALVQTGGRFTADAVTLGNRHATGTSNSTGRYDLSGGTFDTIKLTVGGKGSAAGTFTQSGGQARVGTLIVNEDKTSHGTVRITGGQLVAESAPILANNGYIEVTGGSVNFAPVEGTGSVSIGGDGAMNARRLRIDAVRLSGNGRLQTSFTTSRVNHLSFDESGGAVHGQWNLLDGAVIVDHNGTSPIEAIKRYIKTGHAGGSWTGQGLMLTEAAFAPTPQNLAIGYVEASRLFGANGGVFEGLNTDGSAVLVKSTYYGDTDLNGVINFDDYARIDFGFNNNGNEWFEGDFNYDGKVNFDDYALIDLGFNTQGQPMSSPVPEASSVGVLMALSAIARRNRRE